MIMTETWFAAKRKETKEFAYVQSINDEVRSEGVMIMLNKKRIGQV